MEPNGIPDLRRLNYFVQVVRHAGFRPAALHLGISQPVLSRQVQELEQRYGAVLLQRGAKGVHPTELGKRLLERAETLLYDARSLSDVFLNDRVSPTGLVKIALPTSYSGRMAPLLAESVSRLHSGVKLRIHEGSVLNIIDRVIDGQVDFGVATSPTQTNVLIEESISHEEIFLVGKEFSNDDAYASPEFLKQLPLIMCPFPHGMRSIVNQIAQQMGISLTPAIEIDGTHTLTELLKSGKYYALLPVTSLRREISSGILKTKRVRPTVFRHLVIISLREKPMSNAARCVAKLLSDLSVPSPPNRAPYSIPVADSVRV